MTQDHNNNNTNHHHSQQHSSTTNKTRKSGFKSDVLLDVIRNPKRTTTSEFHQQHGRTIAEFARATSIGWGIFGGAIVLGFVFSRLAKVKTNNDNNNNNDPTENDEQDHQIRNRTGNTLLDSDIGSLASMAARNESPENEDLDDDDNDDEDDDEYDEENNGDNDLDEGLEHIEL
eukprot:gb/GECH01003098.1/.p1 GENE.gb/GECH01003098.1/~~gb/GECH01003098.1/.p1  ORF type:complete len:174 (+),score=51.38 gb/GECH01003098.1/:1-522(+)